MTQGADAALSPYWLAKLTFRHGSGDWGDLDPEDWQANDQVMDDPEHIGRLLSSYKDVALNDGGTGTIWIITDAPETPEAITTVLLPEEY
jgi:hypothetical protein